MNASGRSPKAAAACQQPSARSRRPASGSAYQLSSLLLVTFLIALCLSLSRLAPQVGCVASVIVVLAWLRTAVAASRCSVQGQSLRVVTKIAFFLQSVTIVVCSALLVIATFLFSGASVMLLGVAAELALPLEGVGYAIGIISSGIVGTGTAALAAAFVANALWPIPTTISPLGSWHSSTAEVECS